MEDKISVKRFNCIQPGCDVLLMESDIKLIFNNEINDIALYGMLQLHID